jgi:hypothetical protein
MVDKMDPVLCYVEKGVAWFTTCPLNKQWGDDWNDVPYQHNAGDPYTYMPYMKNQGIEPYELTRVFVIGHLEEPCDFNDHWSVEAINRGETPWLEVADADDYSGIESVKIMAGTTLSSFKKIIRSLGGSIFIEEK